ncbi:GNAT family N-acetyltransferase [Kineococcus sp. LSe6-4]|uniref:GNAT family N-acetyltransferase n=1 Tax=Kineococcus halophytocola TaxID=3234027 RepID=A0ABV4H5V0_9ACTN
MSTTGTTTWTITPATDDDRSDWERLYLAYGEVAGERLSPEHLDRVWSWIGTPAGQTGCLVLREGEQQRVVGLAHYRLFERPLAGSVGCWLDDLFVDPGHRGRGGARAVLEHLRVLAAEHGWSTVRWTTGQTNSAQKLYDQLADRSPVITYNMAPAPASNAR